jgi:hypothetical protein
MIYPAILADDKAHKENVNDETPITDMPI